MFQKSSTQSLSPLRNMVFFHCINYIVIIRNMTRLGAGHDFGYSFFLSGFSEILYELRCRIIPIIVFWYLNRVNMPYFLSVCQSLDEIYIPYMLSCICIYLDIGESIHFSEWKWFTIRAISTHSTRIRIQLNICIAIQDNGIIFLISLIHEK